MPTVIDSLIVEFGLDPTKFTEGQKKIVGSLEDLTEQVDRQGKKVKTSTKGIEEGFNGVVKGIAQLTAGYLSVAAISSFIQQTNTTETSVNRLATTLGLTVEKISQYRQAARLAGISPDAAIGAIQGVGNNLNAFSLGHPNAGFLEAFSRLGVRGSLIGPNGQPISQDVFLERVQAATKRAQSSGQYSQSQITNLLGQLGIGPEMAYVMERNDKAFKMFLEESRKIGTQTKEQTEAAVKLDNAWAKLTVTMDNVSRVLLEKFSPALVSILKMITTWLDTRPDSEKGRELTKDYESDIDKHFGKPQDNWFMRMIFGPKTLEQMRGGSSSSSSSGPPINATPVQGNEKLRQMRQSRIDEINSDPVLKENVLKMLQLEEGSVAGKTAAMEALINRSMMTGNTIREELFSGFYGPINRGGLNSPLGDRARQSSTFALDNVAGGSNTIHGRTDQGMYGDPNANGPGRVRVPGTSGIFNYWKGTRRGKYFSHQDSEEFADELNRKAMTPWGSQTHPIPFGNMTPGILHNQSSIINTQHSSVSIGNISVATAAKNAEELVTGLGDHMRNRLKLVHANTGLA